MTNISDILEHLNIHVVPQDEELPPREPETEEERILLTLLTREPQHIDELTRTSQLAMNTVTSTLTILELDGIVKQVGNMQYVRTTQR